MIQPKHEIGDQVWAASSDRVDKRLTCPDCLGTKAWQVTTAGGDQFELPCGTCAYGFESLGYIASTERVGTAQLLTIVTIRVDTHNERPVSYMMRETSDGSSGSIHYEDDLYLMEDEAVVMGEVRAKEVQASIDKQNEEQKQRDRKKSRGKPPWYERRIKELEDQIAVARPAAS